MAKVKVEFQNIALAFGKTQVLRDIDLTIAAGEFFALLGPSGSGKSTLLRVLAGFTRPQSGRVLLDGRDISAVPPWDRDIGMVFQNYALWPHLSVHDNVAFGLEERRLAKDLIERKVAAALDLVGLRELAARRPSQLSGGQQQRVALARTIAIEPKVLLLDEPLSNLDARLRVHMRTELLALQRKLGVTTLFVTHDQDEALSISDRVAVLDAGVIQQIGTPQDLFDNPKNRFIASFVGTINLFDGVVQTIGWDRVFESPALGKLALPEEIARADGPAVIAIRPHALVLCAPSATPPPGHIALAGKIMHREFLGAFVRYRVQVSGAVLIADQPHRGGQSDFASGDAVAVELDSGQIKILTE